MPDWLPRRVHAGVAVGLALAFAALSNSAAFAGQVRGQEWWLSALHVPRAWESSHGSGVTVAVLDTGVDATQRDLAGSVVSGPDFTHSGRAPGQPLWGVHGTEVASLIAGHGHGAGNAKGITGIAPAAKILSVRVTLESSDPLLTSPAVASALPGAIARGIGYAVRHGASVIDLPLDPAATPGAAGSGGSRAERAAVSHALKHHVVLVAPAGDNGAGTDAVNYPAAYPGVISVGAFGAHLAKAPFSSRQRYVTLTAAGEGVTAATPTGYATLNSTSAASAMVAGIVALIRSQFPNLTPAQVTRVLTHSTRFRHPGGRRDGSGFGVADAAGALAAAARMTEAVPKASNAAAAPPSPPAVPTPPARSLTRTLALDAGAAAAFFLLLLGLIFVIRAFQRRRARSARLAEVRAAARVPARRLAGPAEPDVPSGRARPDVPSGRAEPDMPSGRAEPVGTMSGFFPAPPADVAEPAGPSGADTGAGFDAPGGGLPGAKPAGTTPAAGAPGVPLPFRLPHTSSMLPGGVPATAPPGASPPATGSGAPSAFPASAFPGAAREPGEALADAAPAAGATGFGSTAQASGGQRPGMGTVRRPTVSGSPPWEPAPEPDGELPWNQAPAPHVAGPRPLPRRPPPADPPRPIWEAIAEEEWPGGPRVAGPYPPVAPAGRADPAEGPPGGPSVAPFPSAGEREQTQDRPIYVWSPEPGAAPRDTAAAVGLPPGGRGAAAPGKGRPESRPPWDTIDTLPAVPAGNGNPPHITPPPRAATGAYLPPTGAGPSLPPTGAGPSLPPTGAGPSLPPTGPSLPPPGPSRPIGPYLRSFALGAPGSRGGRPPAGPGTAADSTDVFGALPVGEPAEDQPSPSESTETFPAVPRGEGGGARDDG